MYEEAEGPAIESGDAKLRIVEHVSGVWSYHLAYEGKRVALCGKTEMMDTSMSLGQWGLTCPNKSIRYKWCVDCARTGAMALPSLSPLALFRVRCGDMDSYLDRDGTSHVSRNRAPVLTRTDASDAARRHDEDVRAQGHDGPLAVLELVTEASE